MIFSAQLPWSPSNELTILITIIQIIITNKVTDSWHAIVIQSPKSLPFIPCLKCGVNSAWQCHQNDIINQLWNQRNYMPLFIDYFGESFPFNSAKHPKFTNHIHLSHTKTKKQPLAFPTKWCQPWIQAMNMQNKTFGFDS